jgi:hypothetical protein
LFPKKAILSSKESKMFPKKAILSSKESKMFPKKLKCFQRKQSYLPKKVILSFKGSKMFPKKSIILSQKCTIFATDKNLKYRWNVRYIKISLQWAIYVFNGTKKKFPRWELLRFFFIQTLNLIIIRINSSLYR